MHAKPTMRVTCRCGQALAVPRELTGTAVPCPACGAGIVIPAAEMTSSQVRAPSAPRHLIWIGAGAGGVVLLLLMAIVGSSLLTDRHQQSLSRVPAVATPAPPLDKPMTSGAPSPPPPPAGNSPATVNSSPIAGVRQQKPPPARPGTFVIGPGMYEITAPGAEVIEGDERASSAGLTITGGARLANEVTASEARAQVAEFKRGNSERLGDVTVTWALIIKARPQEPSPNKSPAAQLITVDGMDGIEVRGPGNQVTWAFGFVDHSLMITARGPVERVNSPEVQAVLSSLRRNGNVPLDLAEQAKTGAP